jgi:hypothetical protein
VAWSFLDLVLDLDADRGARSLADLERTAGITIRRR